MSTSLESRQTQTILTGFYQNVAERNSETIASFFGDTVDWYIPKSVFLPWTGRLAKKSEIVKALQLLFDAHAEGLDQFETDRIFIEGNQAAVFGKISRVVTRTGKRFTTPFCHRFTMADGKITHVLMLEDTPEIEKAFYGK